jgi:hypothetical protein
VTARDGVSVVGGRAGPVRGSVSAAETAAVALTCPAATGSVAGPGRPGGIARARASPAVRHTTGTLIST